MNPASLSFPAGIVISVLAHLLVVFWLNGLWSPQKPGRSVQTMETYPIFTDPHQTGEAATNFTSVEEKKRNPMFFEQ
ncbi:MAG: hypothetical protein P1V20_00625 [Verrucomicrobiales bacterium]|nr:hypothetical protein [Verrucomicrobiales bacterium]